MYLTCMPLTPVTSFQMCCVIEAIWRMQDAPYVCLVRATDGKKKISTTVCTAGFPVIPEVQRMQ